MKYFKAKVYMDIIHSPINPSVDVLRPASNYFALRKVLRSINYVCELKSNLNKLYKLDLQSNRRANAIDQQVQNKPAAPVACEKMLSNTFSKIILSLDFLLLLRQGKRSGLPGHGGQTQTQNTKKTSS